MKPENALACINQIREWLKKGASIKAINPNEPILEELEEDKIHSGLYVHIPSTCPECVGIGKIADMSFGSGLKLCPTCKGSGEV